jgi:hypothetical protein
VGVTARLMLAIGSAGLPVLGFLSACLALAIGSAGLPVVGLLDRTGSIEFTDLFLIVLGGRVTTARTPLRGRLAASRAGTACAITGLRVV